MKITEAFKELKKLADGQYCSLDYILTNNGVDIDGKDEIACQVFLKEKGIFEAPTFALALEKLKESMDKIRPDVLDVEG